MTDLAPVPRVALTREEAAASLSMSLDTFERYVQPHVRVIRVGRLRLVAVTDLEEWARGAGESALQPLPGSRVRSVSTPSGPGALERPGPGTRGNDSHAP
jgi:excisionase family DNA binding protein